MEINIDKILKETDYKEFLKFIDIPIRENFLVIETFKVEKFILKGSINELDKKNTLYGDKIKSILVKKIEDLTEKIEKLSKNFKRNQKEFLFEKYIDMYMNDLFYNGLVFSKTKEEQEKIYYYDKLISIIKKNQESIGKGMKADYAEDFSILCSNDKYNRITSSYMTGYSVRDGQEINNTILNNYIKDFLKGKEVDNLELYYDEYINKNHYYHSDKHNITRARNINKNLYTVIISAHKDIYNTLKDEIYKIYHNGYTEEELKQAKEEKQAMYESLFIAKDFLESQMSREKYCYIKNIQSTFFDKAIENLK